MFSQCYIKSIALKKLNFIMKQRWNLTSPQATHCKRSTWLGWSTSGTRTSKCPWEWVKTQPLSSMETLSSLKKTFLLIRYRLEKNESSSFPPKLFLFFFILKTVSCVLSHGASKLWGSLGWVCFGGCSLKWTIFMKGLGSIKGCIVCWDSEENTKPLSLLTGPGIQMKIFTQP